MDRQAVFDLIRANKKELADSSVRTYTSNVLRAHRELGSTAFNKHAEEIPKKFKDKSIAVQKAIVVACLTWARASEKQYAKLETVLKALDTAVRKEVVSQ
jgi:predicted nucleotide-binding protein (sugar kinase/HSP70/actin superfamily)